MAVVTVIVIVISFIAVFIVAVIIITIMLYYNAANRVKKKFHYIKGGITVLQNLRKTKVRLLWRRGRLTVILYLNSYHHDM